MSARRRGVLVGILAAALCLLGYLMLRGRPADVHSPQPPGRGVAGVGRVATPELETSQRASPPASDPSAGEFSGGSIVVVDEAGTEHPAESGSFVIHTIGGPPENASSIAVSHGHWDPQATPEGEYFITGLTLRGREAILTTEQAVIFKGKTAIALRCRWLAMPSLHVVDARGGVELDALTLYALDNIYNSNTEIPVGIEGARLLGEGLTSPVRLDSLPGNLGAVTVYAYRDGFAWGRLLLDRTGGGDQFIRLAPGADVFVDVPGEEPTADMTVRLWRGSGGERSLLAERSLRGMRSLPRIFSFLGLPFGAYEVTLEKGRATGGARLLTQSIQISSTDDLGVELSVPPTPADVDTSVVVVVRLDPSWDLTGFRLTLTDMDLPRNDPSRSRWLVSARFIKEDSQTYRSEPFRVRCAQYELFCPDTGCGQTFFVLPSAEEQVLPLDVPPCATVGLTVVSSKTGLPIDAPTLCWSSASTAGAPVGGGCRTVNAMAPGRIEFRAPAGRLFLNISPGALSPFLQDLRKIDVTGGAQEVLIELAPASLVSFALYDEDRQLEWSSDMLGKVIFRGPAGVIKAQRTALDSTTGLLTCVLPVAERLAVKFPSIPGYEPVEEFEIDLTGGSIDHRVVHVRRAR